MVDYKTIRVPESAYEKAKESKRSAETWGEFIQRCTEEPPEIRELVRMDAVKQAIREVDDESNPE